jgi:hypothetical protein
MSLRAKGRISCRERPLWQVAEVIRQDCPMKKPSQTGAEGGSSQEEAAQSFTGAGRAAATAS